MSGAQEGRMAERDWVDGLDEKSENAKAADLKVEKIVTELNEVYKKEEVARLEKRLRSYFENNDINSEISDPELADAMQRAARAVQAEKKKRERDEQAQIAQVLSDIGQLGGVQKKQEVKAEVRPVEKLSAMQRFIRKLFS